MSRNRPIAVPLYSRVILCGLLLFVGELAAAPPGLASTRTITARGFALASGRPLFTETHVWTYAGEKPVRIVATFRLLDGRDLGTRTTEFTPDAVPPHSAPAETFARPDGYLERVEIRGNSFVLSTRENTSAPLETGTVVRAPGTVYAGGQGLDRLIVARWSEIAAGGAVSFHFLVPARKTAYKFSMRKAGQADVRGRQTLRIRVELSGVLSLVAPALDLYYDAERRHLLRYEGPSNFARETGESKIRVEFFR